MKEKEGEEPNLVYASLKGAKGPGLKQAANVCLENKTKEEDAVIDDQLMMKGSLSFFPSSSSFLNPRLLKKEGKNPSSSHEQLAHKTAERLRERERR